jgi:hypothetical protein
MTHSEHPIETPPRAPSPVHGFGTLAVHAGSPHDPVTGAVIEAVCIYFFLFLFFFFFFSPTAGEYNGQFAF